MALFRTIGRYDTLTIIPGTRRIHVLHKGEKIIESIDIKKVTLGRAPRNVSDSDTIDALREHALKGSAFEEITADAQAQKAIDSAARAKDRSDAAPAAPETASTPDAPPTATVPLLGVTTKNEALMALSQENVTPTSTQARTVESLKAFAEEQGYSFPDWE